MVEIEFSVMGNDPAVHELLAPLLQTFEQQYHIKVKLIGVPWTSGWAEISKYGIFGHGPDVSEIGTTWLASLASMQSLRPFSSNEVVLLGGGQAFFESNWHTCFIPDDPNPFGIPWMGDVLVLYYWKDILEKAGITDLDRAFSSHDGLVNTLTALQDKGIRYPIALTTQLEPRILHEAAGWIWSAGGGFLSKDYKKVIFNQEKSLNGLRQYFGLHRFVSQETQIVPTRYLFTNRAVTMFLAGPSWEGLGSLRELPVRERRLGVARPLEITMAGGSNLVIWKHSLHTQEAYELIRFITTRPLHIEPGDPHHQLPTRTEALRLPSVESDIFQRTLLEALQAGQSFPSVRLWGIIEEKLIQELHAIWKELFANPGEDIETLLHSHLDPLAKRLNLTLGN